MFARAAAPAARAVGRRFISVGDAVPVASATQGLFVVRVSCSLAALPEPAQRPRPGLPQHGA